MNKILVLFAHPILEKSRLNTRLIKSIQSLEGVYINDLYQNYPDFQIDVKAEQKLLLEHDIIIWQHPFYWYSSPAIIKQWQDLVLEHGWAYGKNGKALRGKRIFNAFTSGGPMEAYQDNGSQLYTIHQFLHPFERTAGLCNMIYWPPFWVAGSHKMESEEIERHGNTYRELLISIRDDKWKEEEILQTNLLNELVQLNKTS